VDSKDRVWSQGIRDIRNKNLPWVKWPCDTATEPESVIFRLPVTMPPGTYAVVLNLYDQTRGQRLVAYGATGESLGDRPRVMTLPIAKNKSSVTADQLYIANRYFVDMQELRLLGYSELPDQVKAGTEFEIGLYWRARGKPRGDYWVVIQLRDSIGKIVVEQSTRPAEGTYPTTDWSEGEVLLDWHRIVLPPDIPSEEYQIIVMLKDILQDRILGEARLAATTITR
jgi:hypothetical protein